MDEFLTVAEVAERLKLNQQTVRNWIDAGSLPAYRVGRRIRVSRADFDQLVDASYTGERPPTGSPASSPSVPESDGSIWDGVIAPPQVQQGRPSRACRLGLELGNQCVILNVGASVGGLNRIRHQDTRRLWGAGNPSHPGPAGAPVKRLGTRSARASRTAGVITNRWTDRA